MRHEVECLWPIAAELGEGPVWSAGEGAVWFVDIKGSRIHRFDPEAREGRSWDAPSNPGFLAPLGGGRWLAGLKSGLCRFDPSSGGFEVLTAVEPRAPDNRLNDGCVDPMGRLWFGSMHDLETDPTGALYRLERDGTLRAHDAGYVITNGPAFSPDGRTVYHTDTLERLIYAFDLGEDGRLEGKRVFARVDRGYPDGPAVDAVGCVWSGLFGGWGLNRYAPDGTLMQHVPFPVANVTKPAFGGADLRTVYVTTAWKGLSDADRRRQPLAGGLFAFRTDVPGLPQHEARLDV
jgi:sugar lactone lactonase YvrE